MVKRSYLVALICLWLLNQLHSSQQSIPIGGSGMARAGESISIDSPYSQSNAIESARELLEIGILYKQPETIKRAVNLGANLNHPDGKGFTLLMAAARDNNPERVLMLLRAGASTEGLVTQDEHRGKIFWDFAKQHPNIMKVVDQYNKEIKREVLTARPEEGWQDASGIIGGYISEIDPILAMQEVLMQNPIPWLESIINEYVSTPQSEQKEKTEKIPTKASNLLQAEQTRLNNLLLAALKRKSTTAAEISELLRLNAQLGSQDIEGNTPLILTVIYKRPDLMDVLLEHIKDQSYPQGYLNMTNKAGDTALAWAERLKRNELAAKLLRAGASKIS